MRALWQTPLVHDARGYESQFSTNHLGHFQLTARLWPSLRRADSARVVILSSGAHRFSDIDFDDPNYQHRDYDRWKAYGQAKTANALFALGLDVRAEAYGVRAFSVHPGSIATKLTRHVSLADMQAMGFRDKKGNITPKIAALYKTVEPGAATTVWCAVSTQLDGHGGVYCEDCDIVEAVQADWTELNGVFPGQSTRSVPIGCGISVKSSPVSPSQSNIANDCGYALRRSSPSFRVP